MNDDIMISLFSDAFAFLINATTVAVAAGIFATFRALNAWRVVADRNFYRRCLPILPELLGVIIYLVGDLSPGGDFATHRSRVVMQVGLGIWSAYLAQKFRKILAQTILGDDARITLRPQDVALLMARDEDQFRNSDPSNPSSGPTDPAPPA